MTATSPRDLAPATSRPPLWDHQAEAIDFALAHSGALWDIGMGGGKGRAAIEVAERIGAQRVLVLCPKSVIGVWPRELALYSDRPFLTWNGKVIGRGGKPLANASTSRQAVALLDQLALARATRRPLLAAIGFETCWRTDMKALLLAEPWDLVIIDESHRIKAPGGKASMTIGGIHPLFGIAARCRERGGKVLALSGTPMAHSELDIYAQARAVDPSVFGTSFTRFKARYAGRKVYKIGKATDCEICDGTGLETCSTCSGHGLAVEGDMHHLPCKACGDRGRTEMPCGYCDGHGRHGDPVFMVGPNGEALWAVGQPPRGPVIRPASDGEPIYAVGPRGEPLYEGVDENATGEFVAQLQRFVYRISQEELDAKLGLEPPSHVERIGELLPATRKVYDELSKDLIATLGDVSLDDAIEDLLTGAGQVVTAANRMVLTGRLAQLSGGFTVTADGEQVYVSDPPEKAALLEDALGDLDPTESVVVFCRHHVDLDAVAAVADRLERRYAELSGRLRNGLTDDGCLTPDATIVGVQWQAGGVGVDFTRARYAALYSLPTSLADFLQGLKRLHRPGQQRHVTFLWLLMANTIDLTIKDALLTRRDRIASTLDAINTNKEDSP